MIEVDTLGRGYEVADDGETVRRRRGEDSDGRDAVSKEIAHALAVVARKAHARGRAAGRAEIKKEYGL